MFRHQMKEAGPELVLLLSFDAETNDGFEILSLKIKTLEFFCQFF